MAGRDNGFSAKECNELALTAVRSYRETMREFAGQSILTVWYARLDVEEAAKQYKATLSSAERKRRKAGLKAADRTLAKAYTRDNLQAIGKLTTVVYGQRRIVSDPPLVVPLEDLAGVDTDAVLGQLQELVTSYRDTLPQDRRHLIDHFRLTNVAHKVVGVGSVGTRAWILLMESTVQDDALLLQAKQAGPSVLSEYAGRSEYVNQGERVVVGQRLMQAASDIFLGWLHAEAADGQQDYYVRQLRDWKLSVDIDNLNPDGMRLYAQLCGYTLARAHARSGDRFAIAAYLGKSDRFDRAVAEFAKTYASQNDRDHAALADAVTTGRVKAQPGV